MSKKEVKTNAMRMLDRAKSRIHMKNMNAMILQTVSRPQTNLDMTTNWSIRHL